MEDSKNESSSYSYCSVPIVPERVFSPDVNSLRADLINGLGNKWLNGTVLHYYFFDKPTDGKNVVLTDGTTEWRSWTTTDQEKDVVRRAFNVWKGLGIGLEFKEVNSRDEAEIRIGFMRKDGAWSYVGRDILDYGRDERTMNFGWDLTRQAREIDTAVHEIGHTLGFHHEHQNPNSGIVWDEEAVYTDLAGDPNFWSRDKTYYNIIRKLAANEVQGTNWDPNSIMHYPFKAGLIKHPPEYQTRPLVPAGGLSEKDKTWVKSIYPSLQNNSPSLQLLQSTPLSLTPGGQADFLFDPTETRYYNIGTFGTSDTVVALFEDENGEPRYRTADDDSGEDRNALIHTKLIKGHNYIVRVRLYYSDRAGETAIMVW
ncbi:MAG: hypothetical protein HYR87_10095 [Thaumarchaeota archaeon]|nr:hypothetical protein [Nitrososphaerota archaeon]